MKGFSFIEVMVTLVLVLIVCVFAIPSFMGQSTELKGVIAKAQLLEQLQHAQKIANTDMMNVTVCLSMDGKTCVTDKATMILLMVNNKVVISTYVKGRGTLHLRSYPDYRNYISVLPTITGKSDNGTFWYCSKENILQWAVVVSQSGEPHEVIAKDGVLDLPGKSLEC